MVGVLARIGHEQRTVGEFCCSGIRQNLDVPDSVQSKPNDIESAGESLGRVGVLPSGEGAADLRARYAVANALFELLAKQIKPDEAATRIDAALADARTAGCADVLRAYGSLPDRLRP